jgi:short subunit dehydrogenase-like uncharacterized protein
MLYGATGYTAGLIIRLAQSYGLQPLLAGRNESKIKQLATENGLPYRIFSLENHAEIVAQLQGVGVVLHAAGPFVHTAEPMIKACLEAGVHYTDITGEIAVFERAAAWDAAAKAAGILLMPGIGFDVVPTDCMAVFLKNILPNATHLELAFAGLGGGISHGTALTMVEGMGQSGAVRENGRIVPKPLGHASRMVPFSEKPKRCYSIPWGDVSTAFYSTGIPNIVVYTAAPALIRYQHYFNGLLGSDFIKNWARKLINSRAVGPSDEARAGSSMQVWGRVANAAGQTVEATWVGPEGYTFTAHSALLVTQRVLNGHVQAGFHTPAGLFGPDLAMEVAGTKRVRLPTGAGS